MIAPSLPFLVVILFVTQKQRPNNTSSTGKPKKSKQQDIDDADGVNATNRINDVNVDDIVEPTSTPIVSASPVPEQTKQTKQTQQGKSSNHNNNNNKKQQESHLNNNKQNQLTNEPSAQSENQHADNNQPNQPSQPSQSSQSSQSFIRTHIKATHNVFDVPYGTTTWQAFSHQPTTASAPPTRVSLVVPVVGRDHVKLIKPEQFRVQQCDQLITSHVINRITNHNNTYPTDPISTQPPISTISQRLPSLLPGLSIPSLRAISLDSTSRKVTLSLLFNSPDLLTWACTLFTKLNMEFKPTPSPTTNNFIGTVNIPYYIDSDVLQQHLGTHAPHVPIDIARHLNDMDVSCYRSTASFRCPSHMRHLLSCIPPWPGTPSDRAIEWSYIYIALSRSTPNKHVPHLLTTPTTHVPSDVPSPTKQMHVMPHIKIRQAVCYVVTPMAWTCPCSQPRLAPML